MNIRISADSTCDLSEELKAKYNIRVLPLYIMMGTDSRRDGVDCCGSDLFAYTAKTGKLCSTAAVTVADYADFFETELKTHDAIVHFTISADMSACYQNACIAAEEYPEKVFVVDSRNLSSGIGQLAVAAAEMAAEGKTAAEIADCMNEKKAKLNVSFVLDTLEYLHKGGRCSGVAALGANLLRLKPCIEVHDGKMGVAKKYRGKLADCFKNYVRDRICGHEDVDRKRIFITDSGVDLAVVAELETMLRAEGFEEVYHTLAGGTISGHCGPGCLGILYFDK